jgi:hypothetical protein
MGTGKRSKSEIPDINIKGNPYLQIAIEKPSA